ncbi:hypothetical protein [Natronosalvus vescus]|nr:hypothetical protein [Natronosalvus vescus]
MFEDGRGEVKTIGKAGGAVLARCSSHRSRSAPDQQSTRTHKEI